MLELARSFDETDGKTAETALTITQPDVRLKKNAAAWAQKAAAQTLTHEENGWYELTLDATDTDTIGILLVAIHESGALPVWMEFHVLAANVYDSLFGAATDKLDVNVEEWNTTAVPAEHTAGYPIVTIKDGTGTGEINTNAGAIALVDLVTTTTTLTNLPAITANWLTAAGTAADFGTEVGTAVWASGTRTLTSLSGLTVDTVTTVTNQLTAAQVATGIWQDTTAGDFTVASSIGKSLYTGNVAPGGANGLLIAGSNAATTFAGLTTGALACTTITASGAVAFQSTFAVTTSTALASLSCTTLTASGAVAFQSTFAVTTSTALAALSATTITASGTTSLAAVTTSGTVTLNALTVTNALTVSGTTTLTGAITATNASNNVTLGTLTVTTNAIAWNASWDAEVQSECADAITAAGFTFTVANVLDSNVQRVNDVVVTGTGAVGDEWGP